MLFGQEMTSGLRVPPKWEAIRPSSFCRLKMRTLLALAATPPSEGAVGGRSRLRRGLDQVNERVAWLTSRPNAIAKTQSSSAPTFTATEPGRERFFDKIKQCRRVATRYDKLAANYLAFVKLACIRPWLRFDNRCQFHSAPKRVLVFPAHESPNSRAHGIELRHLPQCRNFVGGRELRAQRDGGLNSTGQHARRNLLGDPKQEHPHTS